eukprot:gene25022-27021_t
MTRPLELNPDRLFPSDPATRAIARTLYAEIADLPIISPHGHTDARWFADDAPWSDATALLLAPDHYIFRMLYSQGIDLDALAIPSRAGVPATDPREAWRLFAQNVHLFRGTPSRIWLDHVFAEVFGFDVALEASTADLYYDTIAAKRAGLAIDDAALGDLYVETMVQSADFSDALLRRTIGRSAPHVLLLHETDIAARYLPALVAALRQDGWTIVTADAAFADPVYHDTSDFVSANGTLPEALAWRKAIGGKLYYERNDLALADRLFAERVLHRAPLARTGVARLSSHRRCPVKLRPRRRVCASTAFVMPRTA